MEENGDFYIDYNLTPQNAKERGYMHIDDVFYKSAIFNKEILELLTKHGHKLGKPSWRNDNTSYAGLYAPIKK